MCHLLIIIIVSNTTVLVSQNVMFVGYFINISHDFENKTLLSASPSSLPHTRFSPGFFAVLQEMLYQPSFAFIRLLLRIIYFQSKTNFFFQLIAGRF